MMGNIKIGGTCPVFTGWIVRVLKEGLRKEELGILGNLRVMTGLKVNWEISNTSNS